MRNPTHTYRNGSPCEHWVLLLLNSVSKLKSSDGYNMMWHTKHWRTWCETQNTDWRIHTCLWNQAYSKSFHIMQRHIALQGRPMHWTNQTIDKQQQSSHLSHTYISTCDRTCCCYSSGFLLNLPKHNTICPVHKVDLLTPAQASKPGGWVHLSFLYHRKLWHGAKADCTLLDELSVLPSRRAKSVF